MSQNMKGGASADDTAHLIKTAVVLFLSEQVAVCSSTKGDFQELS